jgi:phosphosulfolactate synthase (CoM biosynthesis protein A)
MLSYINDDGTMNYIHARSIDSFEGGILDVVIEMQRIIDEMDSYISKLALSVVDIANGEKSTKQSLAELNQDK